MEEILENEGLDFIVKYISSFLDVKELAQSRLVFGMLILHELDWQWSPVIDFQAGTHPKARRKKNIFLRVKFFQDFTSRRSYLDRNWKEEEEPTVQSTISTMIEKLLEWDGMLSLNNSQERKAFQNWKNLS